MTVWGTLASAIFLTLGTPKGGMDADSIFGISIGMPLARVERLLSVERDDDDEIASKEREREEEEEGQKLVRTFLDGELKSVAVAFDSSKRVKWVSGFFRPGFEKPFSAFGPLDRATASDSTAIWTVKAPTGAYRVVAKGGKAKASVIYMLKL